MTETSSTLTDDQWSTLLNARNTYNDGPENKYDEVLNEVADRIKAAGSIGKLDIGGLLFWKRLRANTGWVPKLHSLSEDSVRSVTRHAVQAVNDEVSSIGDAAQLGRSALVDLPGFARGDALASALLFAAAPHRMAVYDRRAHAGLRKLGIDLSDKSGRYGEYMEILEAICGTARDRGNDWSARDVDLALYQLSQGGPAQAERSG